jgi:hypothetical protein
LAGADLAGSDLPGVVMTLGPSRLRPPLGVKALVGSVASVIP